MKPAGACCFWFLALAAALPAQPAPAGPPLRADHTGFLNDVATLILPAEREAFLALQRDYQRERFIVRFWQVRDPFPETARNEFREAWTARLELARSRYPDLEDGRARMLLINGEPGRVDKPLCRSLLKPIEIWTYQGTAVLRGEFTLLFVQEQGNPRGKYRLWHKTEGLPSLMEWGTSLGADYENSARRIASECHSGSDLLGAVAGSLDWGQVENKVELLPKPNLEWLTAFASRSTELPTDALPLPATLEVRFPARHQSRTVVEAMVAVEQSAATAGPTGGYGFLVDGEVLLQGELFESFRYRFDLPAGAAGGAAATLPMMLERYLRPGAYVLILRVTDVHGDRFFRAEQPLEVPRVEATAAPQPELAAVAAAAPAAPAAAPAAERPTGDQTLKLFAPTNELRVGRVRVEATTAGEGIASVVFALNGKRVLAKSRPPWSVELDLGRAPRTHQLRAAALDGGGRELASDELLLNAGPHSFRVRLVQPQRGQRYSSGLRAEAEVAVPMGDTLERVEFFLNEERVATLYQPPFVQPILLPSGQALTYVRAVAYLADGNSAEALTFVNAPEYATEVKVDLVELYATVVDRRNRPIEGLERADFTVFEDDKPQEILRFERVHDLPIRAAVVLDTSASMVEELRDATRAALRFFEEVVTPKDRAAIVTFADRPALVSPFTNNHEVLAGGVASLVADGETALWDAIVYTLHYFSGIRGKRAMVLLSDGEDVSSKYEYDEALDFARRTGVAIYTVGLNLPTKAVDARSKLTRLAEETGGRHFSIQNVSELERVYREIEEELRSQYLLAYQSPQDEPTRYRAVEVKVARPGQEAKTIRGYYP